MPSGQKKTGGPPNPTGKGGFGERPDDINRGGFTKEQRAKHYENHNKALAVQSRMLDAIMSEFNENPEVKNIIDHIRPEINALVRDAMDRWGGKPGQSLDLSSSDGSMSPRGLKDFYADLDE